MQANNDVAKRLIELMRVIRPPLPANADYSVEQKAKLYDQARAVLYAEDGSLRPLAPPIALLVIAALSIASWAAVIAVIVGCAHCSARWRDGQRYPLIR